MEREREIDRERDINILFIITAKNKGGINKSKGNIY